jgi:uncharacterized protein (TIGR02444 family)
MSPAESFWSFSLRVYGKPGVEAACLELQDRFGTDVNLALYCLWIGRALTPEALDRARETAAPLRQFIEPLRQMRRSLPGDDPAREALKQAELKAEKLEQEALERLAEPGTPGSGAAHNLRAYASRLSVREDDFMAAAGPLLAALD